MCPPDARPGVHGRRETGDGADADGRGHGTGHGAGDRAFFDRFAPLYDRVIPPAKREVLAAGLDVAERPVRRVLDLGGGTGRAARALPDVEAVVVDLSRPMLREARESGLRTVMGDVRRLPVADESVDAALLVDALHHVPDVPDALAEVARVLRPGGVLVVRDFDPTTLRGRALVAAEHLFGMESTFYAPAELAAHLADAGLRPVVVETGFGYTVAGVKRGVEPREQ